ncbi:MAG: hypothetical protein J3Q66DRAFT_57487 [Benniella sp.]|nr:MAG: hypothetical protein J3Q66DRAFT_57487 [Benniella sp.]
MWTCRPSIGLTCVLFFQTDGRPDCSGIPETTFSLFIPRASSPGQQRLRCIPEESEYGFTTHTHVHHPHTPSLFLQPPAIPPRSRLVVLCVQEHPLGFALQPYTYLPIGLFRQPTITGWLLLATPRRYKVSFCPSQVRSGQGQVSTLSLIRTTTEQQGTGAV